MQRKKKESVFSDKALQNYLNEISKFKTLPREEEHELAIKAKAGDKEALNKLIQANLKFVVKIAARYQNRGLTLSELISEGNIGLIKAIEKFYPDKDIKLISYAIWWIKQRIMQAIAEKNSLIRVPLGKSNQANKLKAISDKRFASTGETPTVKELSELMEIDPKLIDRLRTNQIDTVSIDEVNATNNNQEVALSENLQDKDTADPQTLFYKERLLKKLTQAINNLEPREAEIIRNYYGMNKQQKAHNFAQIAQKMGLSRERVRQIQKEALKKILNGMEPDEEKLVDAFIDKYNYH
ncbi:MAG TPA: RNA polymerase sigma factor RpoD/SigA [Candidatus Cloacimonadota bacterium]|nr:RNA polymerase sigma factor RpoD/SigA [Candidatus Cloacimonadota bacterium]HQL14692.1 RNA polymerase sigma factor RpoD/SigA [Candidatus Cloacimonadota bacterium]